jgi:hypothetical protein
MSTLQHDSTTAAKTTVDVLELTTEESCADLAHFWNLKEGQYHLTGIKGLAGIGSRDTHITLDQVKALHRELGSIVNGLDKPAGYGRLMAEMIDYGKRSVTEVASDAGVDADALQRFLDGEGPLSHFAYERVVRAQVGVKAATA